MKRPKELIRNFNQLYNLKMGDFTTRPEAYEATEAVWVKETGKRFYKNYNSFQANRSRFLNSWSGRSVRII